MEFIKEINVETKGAWPINDKEIIIYHNIKKEIHYSLYNVETEKIKWSKNPRNFNKILLSPNKKRALLFLNLNTISMNLNLTIKDSIWDIPSAILIDTSTGEVISEYYHDDYYRYVLSDKNVYIIYSSEERSAIYNLSDTNVIYKEYNFYIVDCNWWKEEEFIINDPHKFLIIDFSTGELKKDITKYLNLDNLFDLIDINDDRSLIAMHNESDINIIDVNSGKLVENINFNDYVDDFKFYKDGILSICEWQLIYRKINSKVIHQINLNNYIDYEKDGEYEPSIFLMKNKIIIGDKFNYNFLLEFFLDDIEELFGDMKNAAQPK